MLWVMLLPTEMFWNAVCGDLCMSKREYSIYIRFMRRPMYEEEEKQHTHPHKKREEVLHLSAVWKRQ